MLRHLRPSNSAIRLCASAAATGLTVTRHVSANTLNTAARPAQRTNQNGRTRVNREYSTRPARLQASAAASAPSATGRYGSKYDSVFRRSLDDPSGFWLDAAKDIKWSSTNGNVLSSVGSHPWETRWFQGWRTNACENMIDRHVAAGKGERVALIHDSPVTKSVTKITYAEVQDKVSRLAGALRAAGVGKGDRVILYMPMIPETVYGMLACARLGAIHGVVFGGSETIQNMHTHSGAIYSQSLSLLSHSSSLPSFLCVCCPVSLPVSLLSVSPMLLLR